MPAKLEVRNLSKRYGAVQALAGVSFEVAPGEIVGLLGPNGAGKTTAVESIAGLCEPESGEIFVCGTDARRRSQEAKQRMGISLAATGLPDKITPREAIESFGVFYPRRVPAQEMLTRFDLMDKADQPFDTLSTGQKQRLALALTFVNEPELIILDEPSAGLDAAARAELQAAIRAFPRMREPGAVLMTTHDLEEAETLCDRVVVINSGRVVAEGHPADLIAKSRTTTTISLQTFPEIDPAILAGFPGAESTGSSVSFSVTDVNYALEQLLPKLRSRGIAITELRARKASLEEVIADLIRSR